MRGRAWFDTKEDGDRKRRRQAEFLVHGFLSWRLIEGIGTYNSDMKRHAEAAMARAEHQPLVAVRRNWYY